jgi:hypothetical protein
MRRCGAQVRVCDLFAVRLELRGETAEASGEVSERRNEIRNGYHNHQKTHIREQVTRRRTSQSGAVPSSANGCTWLPQRLNMTEGVSS